jgi:hypothetical protein
MGPNLRPHCGARTCHGYTVDFTTLHYILRHDMEIIRCLIVGSRLSGTRRRIDQPYPGILCRKRPHQI